MRIKDFYLRKGEKVYRFLRVAVLIWHLSIIELVRKKQKRMYTFEKTTVLVWQQWSYGKYYSLSTTNTS